MLEVDRYELFKPPIPRGELCFNSCSYEELIDSISSVSPEVKARKQNLVADARVLVDKYEVSDNFFAAEDNAIGLLLAAALHGEATIFEGKSEAKQESDRVIADSFAKTLFGCYSEEYPLEGVKWITQLSDEDRFALHQRYTNVDLSDRLTEWFQTSDELLSVREMLGIQGEPEDFNILVLSIGSPLHTKGFGRAKDSPAQMDTYIKDLYSNGEAFMREQESDPNDDIPYGYNCTILGKPYLCIMEPTARVLLEPATVGYEDDGKNLEFILALMKHEFVHTQGSLLLIDVNDSNGFDYLGLLLEEYRAETFSGYGFESFYPDVYSTIECAEDYTGINISEIMRSIPYGGGKDKSTLYGLLIQQFGLNNSAKLVGLLPQEYIDFQSPQSSRDLFEALDQGDLTNQIIADMTDEQLEVFFARQEGMTSKAKRELIDWMNGIRRLARA